MTFICITDAAYHTSYCSDVIDIDKLVDMAPGETCSDYLLAQMLQHEYDREHDAFLDKEEQHWNGTSKGMLYYTVIVLYI